MWIVFIVSCIPTVRPIFVKVINKVASSSGRAFPTNRGYAAQTESCNGIRVDAYSLNKKAANSKVKSVVTNNDSEENILPGQDGIRMTTDIRIQYQEERSNSLANKKRSSSQQWETRYDDRV